MWKTFAVKCRNIKIITYYCWYSNMLITVSLFHKHTLYTESALSLLWTVTTHMVLSGNSTFSSTSLLVSFWHKSEVSLYIQCFPTNIIKCFYNTSWNAMEWCQQQIKSLSQKHGSECKQIRLMSWPIILVDGKVEMVKILNVVLNSLQ